VQDVINDIDASKFMVSQRRGGARRAAGEPRLAAFSTTPLDFSEPIGVCATATTTFERTG
jgi:hypothetical protein